MGLPDHVLDAPALDAAVIDGRHQRSARSRDAVVEALLSLYDDGHLRPGVALIADRAGVSQSSVFRHFQDVDELVRSAIDHQWDRLREHFTRPLVGGSLEERISALVAQRIRLYDIAGPALRAARLLAPDSAAVRSAFALRRELLRGQVEDLFAAELAALPSARRRTTLDALDVVTGFEAVEALRIDRGAGIKRTTDVLTLTIKGLLS